MNHILDAGVCEIEITPEMLAVGAEAFAEYEEMFEGREVAAERVFRAMLAISPARSIFASNSKGSLAPLTET